ncbi:MAG: EamA family transporter [Chitinophagaceae bacterium]
MYRRYPVLLSKGIFNNLTLKFNEGDVWVITAAFSFSFYNILVKKKPAGISTGSFLVATFFIGTLLLVPLFHLGAGTCGAHTMAKPNWCLIFYTSASPHLLFPFFSGNLAINRLGAGRASLFGNLIPVFSSNGAVLFFA